MQKLTAAVAFLGAANAYTLPTTNVYSRTAMRSSSRICMDEAVPMNPTWNDPREGKPFGDADRDDATGLRTVGGVRAAVEAYQPRGISDATVVKPQYIGTDDDEPWHASSRQTVSVSKADLDGGFTATLPFATAEAALTDATIAAKGAKDVKAAISAATAAGARPGCPAIVTAEKVIAAFDKSAEEGAKAKPKGPKAGAQGKGWDGMARAIGKVHDNSVA